MFLSHSFVSFVCLVCWYFPVLFNVCLVLLFAVDTIQPVIQFCPQPITREIPIGVTSVDVTWTPPTAFDNSGQTPTVQSTHQPGNTFTVGTSTVSYTFTDAAGNPATCSFQVTVVSGKNFITYTVDLIRY